MRSEQFLRVADLRLWLEKPSSGLRVIGQIMQPAAARRKTPIMRRRLFCRGLRAALLIKSEPPTCPAACRQMLLKGIPQQQRGGEGQGAAIEFPVTANILSRCASSNCFAFIFRLQNASAKSNEVTFPPLYCVFEAAPRTGVLSVDRKKKKMISCTCKCDFFFPHCEAEETMCLLQQFHSFNCS